MTISVLGMLTSGAVCLCLVLLFQTEDRRGKRFFEPFRRWFDARAHGVAVWWSGLLIRVERDFVGQTLRYFLHRILSRLITAFQSFTNYMRDLQRANKMNARRALEEGRSRTMFDEIKDYKKSMVLSSREQKKIKEQSIGGKL